MLHHGLYEQVINNALTSELAEIPEARKAVAPIDKAEASKVLAQYLADVVQKGLDNVVDNGGDLSAQIALTNQIVGTLTRQQMKSHSVLWMAICARIWMTITHTPDAERIFPATLHVSFSMMWRAHVL